MTWQELHERMDHLADVIGPAAENPRSAIDFSGDRLTIELHGGATSRRRTVA
jgi:hypothetical protein